MLLIDKKRRVRYEVDTDHPQQTHKTRGGLAILAVLVVTLCVRIYDITKVDMQAISGDDCTLCGYTKEISLFVRETEVGYLELPPLNQYIRDITVRFWSAWASDMDVRVFCSTDGTTFSEYHKILEAGTTELTIPLQTDVVECRIQFGWQPGDGVELAEIVINDRHVQVLELFYTLVLWLYTVLILCAFYYILMYHPPLEKIFSLLTFTIGLFYLITITPASPPDELYHYHHSYRLSDYLMGRWNSATSGNVADFDFTGFVGHSNVASGYLRILSDWNAFDTDTNQEMITKANDLFYFVPYFPQALGVTLSRLIGSNVVRTFLIGRIFNLAFYAVVVYFVIKRTPKFKVLFGLTALLPMSLQQAASFSTDPFITSCAMYLTASILKCIYEDGPMSKEDYLHILISGMLLAPAKVVYAAILLLVFLIPSHRFKSKKDYMIKLVGLFFACGSVVLLFNMAAIVALSGANDVPTVNVEGQHTYPLSYVLSHPLATINIFCQTLKVNWENYLFTMVGYALSGLNLLIDPTYIRLFLFLLTICAFKDKELGDETTLVQKVFSLAAFSMVMLLTMFVMMIGWTREGQTTIGGVQGRYFIPVLPLLLMALNNNVFSVRKNLDIPCVLAAVLLQGRVIYSILEYTIH